MSSSDNSEYSGERALTREEFRRKYRLSHTTFYAMRREGRGPDELHIRPKLIRISPEAERVWQHRMAEEAQAEADKLKARRRVEQAKIAGALSAESDRHISKANVARARARAAATDAPAPISASHSRKRKRRQ